MAFGSKKQEDSFHLEIDISHYNNLKIEIQELQTRTTVLISDANAATSRLKSVVQELNVTLGKIEAARRK